MIMIAAIIIAIASLFRFQGSEGNFLMNLFINAISGIINLIIAYYFMTVVKRWAEEFKDDDSADMNEPANEGEHFTMQDNTG